MSVKSILVEDFVVQQISDDLFEISVDVGTELQNIFDAVMKVCGWEFRSTSLRNAVDQQIHRGGCRQPWE